MPERLTDACLLVLLSGERYGYLVNPGIRHEEIATRKLLVLFRWDYPVRAHHHQLASLRSLSTTATGRLASLFSCPVTAVCQVILILNENRLQLPQPDRQFNFILIK